MPNVDEMSAMFINQDFLFNYKVENKSITEYQKIK